MDSEKPKLVGGKRSTEDEPRVAVVQPIVGKPTVAPEIRGASTSEPQSEEQTRRGRNERLLKTIADLVGVPETSLMPGAEPLGPGSQIGELSEVVQTFLTIEDPGERHRILETVRQAARTKKRS